MDERLDRFVCSRSDGRSNVQVILDHVKDGVPGAVYTFEELAIALSNGANKIYEKRDVSSIVNAAFGRLSREQQRVLESIRGVGYRLAPANDHHQLALTKKRKADWQIRRGLMILRNVRWDEMTEQTKAAHEATLLVVGGLYQQQMAFEKRTSKIETALAAVIKKVERAEQEVE